MRKTHPELAIEQFEKEYPELAKEFKAIQQEQYNITAKKMLDYGIGNIAQGTNLETEKEKKFALMAIFIRMNDKMNRWKNMILSDKEPQNESLMDTYKDLSNYAIIAQLVEKNKWKK